MSPERPTRGGVAARTAELAALAARLGDDSASSRGIAHAALLDIDESSLDAVQARIRAMASRRPPADDITDALAEIRRMTGSRRADDHVDIAAGVLPALSTRRDPAMVAACEAVLLWRALERLGTRHAYRLIGDIVALDGGAWDQETHRVVDRVGAHLGPTLVEFRSHPNTSVRRWSRWGTAELGFDQPGRTIQLPAVANDTALLADTLGAWGAVHQLDAMRVVVSFVGSEHGPVRDAARAALDQFGRNAVWIVREQLALVSGRDVDPGWGWERTRAALLDAHDEARLAPVRTDLARGEEAKARGDWEAMATHYDRVLLRAPELAHREAMAPGYASLGSHRRARNNPVGAARSLRRAIALAVPGRARDTWSAELRAIEADMDLARGVADLHVYQERASRSPGDTFAAAVIGGLNSEQTANSQQRRRLAAAASAALCLVAAATLLSRHRRARSTGQASPQQAEPADEPPSDTSPGSIGAVA